MNSIKSGGAYAAVFDLGPGGVIAPLSARVTDELDQVVVDWRPVDHPAAGENHVTVVVSGADNTLMPPQIRGLRVVELRVSLPEGDRLLSATYVVTVSTLLVPGLNSFDTYRLTLLRSLALTEGTLAGWSSADEDLRVRALEEAFHRIRELPVVIEWENNQSVIRDNFFDPPRLRDLSAEQILALDERLLKALKQAQLIEADAILTPDPVGDLRRTGLVSQTTGESSMFFGAARPLVNAGVNEKTLRTLSKWLRVQQRIVRR